MKKYYYHNILRKNIIQFLDLFNNIKIIRYNKDGTRRSRIKVPLKYGPKEKVWYWLHERKNEEILPIMSASMTALEFDSARVGNKLNNIIKSVTPSASRLERFPNPTPYNISFSINVWSLHMVDIDQILEQILPYFAPEVMMRVKIPELDASVDTKVVFLSCSPDVNDVMADDEVRVLKWNIDFLVHAWLFKPLEVLGTGDGDAGFIEKMITRFYTNKEVWEQYRYLDTTSTFTSGASGHEAESLVIKGVPPWQSEVGIMLNYERWDGADSFDSQHYALFDDEEGVFWDSIYFDD